MDYKGKLYGKIGNKHFDTGKTAEDWDEAHAVLEHLLHEIENPRKSSQDGNTKLIAKPGKDLLIRTRGLLRRNGNRT